ncbi:MAG TPA: hypothetical protein VKG92_10275 [Flavobacteriales bacterium]|nr:hypothetical protein [Flavobacteriales bacterium]
MDQLLFLDPQDLQSLLATEPERLLGRIMELNRAPRYHNRLDAVALLSSLVEMRQAPQRAMIDGEKR